MEQRGKVNVYAPYKWTGEAVFTVNLANGVTPFMLLLDGKEYSSNFYRLGHPTAVTITHAWYRVRRQEFDSLDESVQGHVLNGGLLHAPIAESWRQLEGDPVVCSWDAETFYEWTRKVYGRRLPPLREPGS